MSVQIHQHLQLDGVREFIDHHADSFDDQCLRTVSRWTGYLAFVAVWAAIIWWIAR